MSRQTPKLNEVVYQMIKYHPLTREFFSSAKGVNVSKAAEKIGMPQPSLKKILDGQTRSMRFETEELLKEFFGVNSAQLRGEMDIDWIVEELPTESLDKLIELARNLNKTDLDKTAEFIKSLH